MRKRLLALSLLAYPRSRRAADGDYLHDLALELGERTGTGRQALSLLRGGLLERLQGRRRATVLLAGGAVVAMLSIGGVAVADEGSHEVEVQSCADPAAGPDTTCAAVAVWAADLEREGWRCDEESARGAVTWLCRRP